VIDSAPVCRLDVTGDKRTSSPRTAAKRMQLLLLYASDEFLLFSLSIFVKLQATLTVRPSFLQTLTSYNIVRCYCFRSDEVSLVIRFVGSSMGGPRENLDVYIENADKTQRDG